MFVGRWYMFAVRGPSPKLMLFTKSKVISTVKKLLASITTFLLTSLAGGATAAGSGANLF